MCNLYFIVKYLLKLCKYLLEDEDHPQRGNESKESPISVEDKKDVEEKQNGINPGLSKSSPKVSGEKRNMTISTSNLILTLAFVADIL